MNNYKQIDAFVAEWKSNGLSKEKIIVNCAEAELGWPYVWGAVGAQCTPSQRQSYANSKYCPDGEKDMIRSRCQVLSNKKSDCKGCEFFPDGERTLIDDCQGFVKQVMSRVGISFAGGGCTSMWNTAKNWSAKGSIKDMPNVVCCVFYNKDGTMEHIGIHVGGGEIIHCSGTVKRGSTKEKMWTHYAIPKGLDGDIPVPTTKPTLRKGSSGEYVVECQNDLIQLGYDLSPYGADGKFGNKTETAVKQFQRDHGLTADGVVGQKTWAALDAAVKPTPVTKLYTVHIPHLTEYKADALIQTYPGAWKTEE